MSKFKRRPMVSMTSRPQVRGFLSALFTAGVVTYVLVIFPLAPMKNLPHLFIVILCVGLIGSQLQERMRRTAALGKVKVDES